MALPQDLPTYAGLPVVNFDHDEDPADPAAVAWRVEADVMHTPSTSFEEAFERMLARSGPGGPVALVLGEWGESYEDPPPLGDLVKYAGQLTGLRALFVGDIGSDQCDLSGINQDDYGPLLQAFPRLERLGVRGGLGLGFTGLRHDHLTELIVQSGGLPPAAARMIAEGELPALTHLELWLGVEYYGGVPTLEDLAPILGGRVFPALTHLGLCNAENADELATALAAAPVVGRLTGLDLSLGTLGAAGAEALLTGQPLTHLSALDLRHHFMPADLARRLVDELPGVRVDISDFQHDGDSRYTMVSE